MRGKLGGKPENVNFQPGKTKNWDQEKPGKSKIMARKTRKK